MGVLRDSPCRLPCREFFSQSVLSYELASALADVAKDSPARLLKLENNGFTTAEETDKLL